MLLRSFRPSDRPNTARVARERAAQIASLERLLQDQRSLKFNEAAVSYLEREVARLRAVGAGS